MAALLFRVSRGFFLRGVDLGGAHGGTIAPFHSPVSCTFKFFKNGLDNFQTSDNAECVLRPSISEVGGVKVLSHQHRAIKRVSSDATSVMPCLTHDTRHQHLLVATACVR